MYHDFFGWVRLILLVVLILVFALFCNVAETRYQMEKNRTSQETPTEINPQPAEATPEPTFSNPTEETTQSTEAAVIATEPPTEAYPYTDEELEMLALVIYQEAGADFCSDETRLMVGTVVMNRIADPRFPDTMYEVITEERAYGELYWTGIVWPARASHHTEEHAVERAYNIAEQVLLGERVFEDDVIFQSEYIMGEIVAYSDGLYFCR